MLSSLSERLSNAHALPYAGTGSLTLGALDFMASSGSLGGWLFVILGLAANLLYIIPRKKAEEAKRREAEANALIAESKAEQERYDSMERRLQLCAKCKNLGEIPNSCIVPASFRPKDCTMLGKKPPLQ